MMRWSIIRLIWLRDLRDQLRDRRTLFMIAGLPLLLYPVLGTAVFGIALGFSARANVIGVVRPAGSPDEFPPREPAHAGKSAVPAIAWLSVLPGATPAQAAGAFALAQADHLEFDYPALIASERFHGAESRPAAPPAKEPAGAGSWKIVYLDKLDQAWLDERKGDLILSASGDFYTRLDEGDDPQQNIRPTIAIHARPADEFSRQARQRIERVLRNWERDVKRVRLARHGLAEQFDEPIRFDEPPPAPAASPAAIDLMSRLFPFMLVLWSLAGALYPAVDLCAGEKERGTMETLLITPAGREEIVLGKFLTIWLFSTGTALINLLSMGLTTALFAARLPQLDIPIAALFWCVLLSLPQAALFSAISLAIGAYARSSKEGQYYLMPLFLATMPLIFLTLAPGVQLNAFYSLVPVTGVALLMQQLMVASSFEQVPWLYFAPVLGPIALYSWLALRWAIEQFQREEVLFREAERWDWGLWLRRLFREKEPLPTTGQALFCFSLILSLRWLSMGLGGQRPSEVHAVIVSLAFVAAPPLFMALLLNTLPRNALFWRWPDRRALSLAALLALLLVPPLAALAHAAYDWFPHPLFDPHPLAQLLRAPNESGAAPAGLLMGLLAYALVPAVCEELAFRGFILTGLHRRFRPRNAILASAFLFALYHMNVFLLLPAFGLGIVLGLLTVRSLSLVPAILFHFLHNALFLVGAKWADGEAPPAFGQAWAWLVGACAIAALALLWWLYRRPYVALLLRARQHQRAKAHGKRSERWK
jgi:sodium transport system permease protein